MVSRLRLRKSTLGALTSSLKWRCWLLSVHSLEVRWPDGCLVLGEVLDGCGAETGGECAGEGGGDAGDGPAVQ